MGGGAEGHKGEGQRTPTRRVSSCPLSPGHFRVYLPSVYPQCLCSFCHYSVLVRFLRMLLNVDSIRHFYNESVTGI